MVAVTILALAIVPLGMMFYSSINISVRSQEIGEVTVLARNIAEQFESMDFSDWTKEAAPSLNNDAGELLLQGQYLVESPSISSSWDVKGEHLVTTEKNHVIGYKDINYNGNTYDVVVTANADDPSYQAINSQLTPIQTPLVNVFTQTRFLNDPDADSWNEFLQLAGNHGYSTDHLDKNSDDIDAKRKIIIDVTTKNIDGTDYMHATVQFIYQYTYPRPDVIILDDGTSYIQPVDPAVIGTTETITLTKENVTSASGSDVMANGEYPPLHIMIYPWYTGKNREEILIKNLDDVEVPILLVKLVDPVVNLNDLEFDYANKGSETILIESEAGEISGKSATVLSNMGELLYDNITIADKLKGNTEFWVAFGSEQYRGKELYQSDTELLNTNNLDRIYRITVEVFDDSGTYTNPEFVFTTTNVQ